MSSLPVRLLVFGAHPDDAEYHAGGLATIYRRVGHVVKFVSVTDGAAGHHARTPEELRAIRSEEARAAAASIGADSEVWSFSDGALEPTLDVRRRVIREIRAFQPDLVLTHRTNDYHPDHRAVGQAVQDASFLITVPLVEPGVPALRRPPVVAAMIDPFTRPAPLQADIVLDTDPELDAIVRMLACHASQMFEWIPWLTGIAERVPADPAARLAFLRHWFAETIRDRAERCRGALVAAYGPRRGGAVQCCEAFEISQYGAPLDDATRQRLFGCLQVPAA
jgi:LmbE family N-acetylglucosaminyl deacetylase